MRGQDLAPGIEEGARVAQQTMPGEAYKRLGSEISNLIDTIALPLEPGKIKLINDFADGVKSLAEKMAALAAINGNFAQSGRERHAASPDVSLNGRNERGRS